MITKLKTNENQPHIICYRTRCCLVGSGVRLFSDNGNKVKEQVGAEREWEAPA